MRNSNLIPEIMASLNEVVAVVPSAGKGARLARAADKPYILFAGKPLIVHTLRALSSSPSIKEIVLVVEKNKIAPARSLVRRFNLTKVKKIIAGGRTRAHSVYNGLKAVPCDYAGSILIHDGARPCVTKNLIRSCIREAARCDGAIAAVPVTSTIKKAGAGKRVIATLERRRLWAVQTPQVFKRDVITTAYREAIKRGIYATDDAALVELAGGVVRVVMGDAGNIKITVPEDLLFAEAIFANRNRIRHS